MHPTNATCGYESHRDDHSHDHEKAEEDNGLGGGIPSLPLRLDAGNSREPCSGRGVKRTITVN